jgi:E3 ubiquitin-protein ligase TRIP12
MAATVAAASSSRLSGSDVEMVESEYTEPGEDCVDPDLDSPTRPTHTPEPEIEIDNDAAADADDAMHTADDAGAHEDDDDDDDADDDAGPGAPSMDEAAAMAALFGTEFRQLGSYMLGMSSRLKGLLASIGPGADPTTRLLALQELAEVLSMSTEDTLASFPVESAVRALVRVLGGSGRGEDEDAPDDDADAEMDESAQLAAALALSGGGSAYAGDENPEAQVLACRCLANLMEALPGCAHTIVYHGAIPVLCSKLIEISYIDLAEQTLSVSGFVCVCAYALC